ncbi:MAG: methyltransferase domain-containing protein [Acidobacteria bacterium]|nr:methyltransferase domain-containing protein [Acidobacteriota bacterium]
MTDDKTLLRMRREWDQRARSNAFHYVANSRDRWNEEEFAASGRQAVEEMILNDAARLRPDGDWASATALEIGCGAGRMTAALADVFGEVHAVDVSPEMLRIAGDRLRDKPNVRLHEIDGRSLEPLGEARFDVVFSYIVLQHIPQLEVIESLVRQAAERTRPGGVLKLQVQGDRPLGDPPRDTWIGATVSAVDVLRWTDEWGLELTDWTGVGEQEFWVWLRRSPGTDGGAADGDRLRLLLESERAWRTAWAAQAAELERRTAWARGLDETADRLRQHLQRIYGSPAYRWGRRLGLAPDPINESLIEDNSES